MMKGHETSLCYFRVHDERTDSYIALLDEDKQVLQGYGFEYKTEILDAPYVPHVINRTFVDDTLSTPDGWAFVNQLYPPDVVREILWLLRIYYEDESHRKKKYRGV